MTARAKPSGRVLVIAGSDSGAGAGIQADIKTVMALGGYATTAVTALTAQNTKGVFGVFGITPEFVADQVRVVIQDIGADCWKTGMLHDGAVIEMVADVFDDMGAGAPLVIDPVMVAKGGHSLLDPSALDVLKRRLIPSATIVTPNVPEAEHLSGRQIGSQDEMARAAESVLALGCQAVLLKGGHLQGHIVYDLLCTADGVEVFEASRIASRQTHGTGCTLASAIATGLAQGVAITDAVMRGRAYLRDAILSAKTLGHGDGPMNHAHTIVPFEVEA